MTEQEVRIERLEKEIEILKKRVDYFYEEIRPNIMRNKCKHKHSVADDNGAVVICYHRYGCENCEYKRRCEKL